MAPPVVLKTQAVPAPTAIRFRAFSDELLTHRASGLDPNYSPNPTRPLEPLDPTRLLKLSHLLDNTHLKALRSGKPLSAFPCPFCNILRTTDVIDVNDENTLCVFKSIGLPVGFEMHLLCIPLTQPGGGHITNVAELNMSHLPLLKAMRDFSIRVLGQVLHQNGMALDSKFFLLFHVPPFNSIDHLHLHISLYPPHGFRIQLGSPLHDATADELITDPHEIARALSQPNISAVTRGAEEHESEHLLISVDQLIELLEDGHGVCSALRGRKLVNGVKEYELLLASRPLVG